MNETATEIQPPKSTGKKFLLLVAALFLIIGAAGYFASKTGLDKVLVKQALDNFSEELKQAKSTSDYDVSFTYKDLAIEGGFSTRHAIVMSPQIVKKYKDGKLEVYRTASIALFPTSADLASFRVDLEKPLTIHAQDEADAPAILTITQKSAIIANFSTESRQSGEVEITHIDFPESFLVDGPKDNADDPWNKMTVSLAPGATFSSEVAKGKDVASGIGTVTFNAQSLLLTPDAAPQNAIAIKAISASINNVLNDKKQNIASVVARLDSVVGNKETLPYGPVNFAIDASFQGALAKSPQAFSEVEKQEVVYTLKTLTLNTGVASLNATADFVSGSKDVLPVGTANITIERLNNLVDIVKSQGLVSEKDLNLMDVLVKQISGKTLAETKDLSIDIKRVRDGAFQIGNTTFEELAATFFSHSLNGLQTEKAPSVKEKQTQNRNDTKLSVDETDKKNAASTKTPDSKVIVDDKPPLSPTVDE